MNIFQNQYLIQNLTSLLVAGLISFTVAFLLTPWIGRLARAIGAVDLPQSLRSKTERSLNTRIGNKVAIPRLGGVAMFVAIIVGLLITGNLAFLPKGVVLGALIILILGILDDTFELDGKVQLLGQALAAGVVIFTGTSITEINLLGHTLSFNLFSATIDVLGYVYNFIFPADIITLLWILGLMNVINWVGGVDGLTGSISTIAAATMLLFVVAAGNIPLAIIIAIHIGAIQGVFPFNYNPAKIYYGVGDYLNGYLLAIFAILSGTRWTATIILLGMPIIDGLLVVYMRIKANPKLIKKPWEILQIGDTSHLHHRLIAVGYSRKTVLMIEVAIMLVLCSIAIYFSNIRDDVSTFAIGLIAIFVIFAIVNFLKRKNEKKVQEEESLNQKLKEEEEGIVKGEVVTVYQDNPEEEKFKY